MFDPKLNYSQIITTYRSLVKLVEELNKIEYQDGYGIEDIKNLSINELQQMLPEQHILGNTTMGHTSSEYSDTKYIVVYACAELYKPQHTQTTFYKFNLKKWIENKEADFSLIVDNNKNTRPLDDAHFEVHLKHIAKQVAAVVILAKQVDNKYIILGNRYCKSYARDCEHIGEDILDCLQNMSPYFAYRDKFLKDS